MAADYDTGTYKPEFFSPLYEDEISIAHTKQNLMEAGLGSVAGAILGAAMYTIPGALPASMTLMGAMGSGAVTGLMPGLAREGVMAATNPQASVQGVRGVGQGLKRSPMMPASAMEAMQQWSPEGGAGAPGPWTPGFMNQMTRYS